VKIGRLELFRIVVATDVGGAVMPNAVGGAPLKLAMLVRQGYRPGQATTLTLWGNIEDTIFYVFAISVSLSLTRSWEHPLWQKMTVFLNGNQTTAAILFVSLVLIFLIFRRLFKRRPQAAGWLEKLRHSLTESRAAFKYIGSKGRKPFLWSLAALSAQWLTRFCILPAVLLALGFHEVDFSKIFLLQWMVFVAMLLTPTPGATGGAEAAFLLVFAGVVPDGSAAVVMVLWRLLTYYLVLVTGAVILAGSNGRKLIGAASGVKS
jgi:uncharacterized protein (TIRG00374 family)